MAIAYEYKKKGNLFEICIMADRLKETDDIGKFYFNILSASFLHENICMVTIQPQKHSLGYELVSFYNITIGTTHFLINEILDCEENLLKDISCSEEFRRGLLILFINNTNQQINEFVGQLNKYQSNIEQLSTNEVVISCDPDGQVLILTSGS